MNADNSDLDDANAALFRADRELGKNAFEVVIAPRFPEYDELVHSGVNQDEPTLFIVALVRFSSSTPRLEIRWKKARTLWCVSCRTVEPSSGGRESTCLTLYRRISKIRHSPLRLLLQLNTIEFVTY